MELPVLYLRGHRLKLLNYIYQSLEVVLILANGVDPDVIQHYVVFHLVLHCLPNYPFRGFQYAQGLIFSIMLERKMHQKCSNAFFKHFFL